MNHRKFVKSEKGIVEKLEPKLIIPAVPYYKLFRFATKGDIFLVFLGITFASVASLGLPYGMIMYGEVSLRKLLKVLKFTDFNF